MNKTMREQGKAMFEEVTGMPAHDPSNPYDAFVMDRVFGEVWTRPGLSRRDRRWISLTSVVSSSSSVAIEIHMRSALDSGDISVEELQEFVLHYAIYNGMPKATNAYHALQTLLNRNERS